MKGGWRGDETETRCWWCDIFKVTCCRWSDRNILVIWRQNHKVLLNLTKQKPKVEGRGSCSADGLKVIQCFRCEDVDLSHQGRVMMSDCGFTCIEAYRRLIAWLSGLMIWGTRCLTSSLSLFSIISRRLQCSWNQSDIMARPSLVASWPAHSPDISASQHVGWTVVSDVPLPVDLQQLHSGENQLVIRSRLTDSQFTRPYFRGWKSVSQIKSVSCQCEQLTAHLCTNPAVQSAPWCDSPVGRTAEQRGGRETLQSLLNSWEMIKNRDVMIVECFINHQICSWLIDRNSNHQLSFLNLLSKQNKVKYCLFVLIFCCVPLRSIKNHHHTSAERRLIFMCRCFTHTVVCSSSFVEAERRRLMLETSSEH